MRELVLEFFARPVALNVDPAGKLSAISSGQSEGSVPGQQVHRCGDSEFFHQTGLVGGDSFVSHAESIGDFLVAPALAEQGENLQLAVAEG